VRKKYELKQQMDRIEQDSKYYHEERKTNELHIADYKLRKAQLTRLLGVSGEVVDAQTLKSHINAVRPEGTDLADVYFEGMKRSFNVLTEDDLQRLYGKTGGRKVLIYLCRKLKVCNLAGNEDARTAWLEMASAKRDCISENERNGWDTTDPTKFNPKLYASTLTEEKLVDCLVVYLDLDESGITSERYRLRFYVASNSVPMFARVRSARTWNTVQID
jgi:hypothetical protein